MSDVRWEGLSHEEIYALVQRGPGAAASADAEGAWGTVAGTMRAVDERLGRAVAQINEGWEGVAAEGVRGGMTTMSTWAVDAADNAVLTQNGVAAQGSSAGNVRTAMPPPQPSAELDKAVAIGSGLGVRSADVGAIEDRVAADRARAVDLMNRYTSDSTTHQHLMNYWTQPPTVVVETAPRGAAAAGARVGGGIGSGIGAVLAPAGGAAGQVGAPGPATGADARGPTPAEIGTGVGAAAIPPGGAGAGAPDASGRTGPGAGGTGTVAPPVPGSLGVPGPARPGPRVTVPPEGAAGGVRPVVPGPPPGGSGARSGGGAFGERGVVEPVPRTPAGGPVEGGGGRVAEHVAGERPVGRAGSEGGHGFFPIGGGAARAGDQDHQRPGFLLDDTDAFADDRWFTPPVIGGDDLEVSRV